MICDFICDYFIHNDKQDPIDESGWDYLYDLGRELGMESVMKVAKEKENSDPKEFKAAMLEYIMKYGYSGSIMHNKFKRMPLKTIAKIIGK